MIIIRALTHKSVPIEIEKISSDDSDESLTSYEREILEDCQPVDEDELLRKVLK